MTSTLNRFAWERELMGEFGPTSSVAVAVGLVLATHADRELFAYPSIAILAKESRYGERAVWGALDELVMLGWLSKVQVKAERRGKGWRRNTYTLTLPNRHVQGARPSGDDHVLQARANATGLAREADGVADGLAREGTLVTSQVRTNNVRNTINNSENNPARSTPELQEQPRAGQPDKVVLTQKTELPDWNEVRRLGTALGIAIRLDEGPHIYRDRVMRASKKSAPEPAGR